MSGKSFKIFVYLFLAGFLIYKYGIKTYFHFQEHEQSVKLYQSISSDTIPWKNLGYTALGNTIYILEIGDSQEVTLIVGGIHGDEFGSLHLLYKLAYFLNESPNLITKKVVIIPMLNPDGLLADTRTNSNGVDIVENFPSRNWSPVYQDDDVYPGSEPASETETLLVMEVLNTYKPSKIIALTSSSGHISFSGPAQGLANNISQNNGYDIIYDQKDMGSLGEYLGRDLNISCVNINLSDYNPQENWLENKNALLNAINY